jgi:hypothetical protein
MGWLPVPGVTDNSPDYDIAIALEPVPDRLSHPISQTARFEARPGQLLFKTRTIADFWVQGGERISIAPKPEVENLRLCNLLFGGVTGGLLIQRGILALHGCSIATPKGAAIVCGHSGTGKSTLTALMLERGFRILDDNIAALKSDGDRFCVQPGLGFLRLTKETIELLQIAPSKLSYPAPFDPKYLHFLPLSGFCDRPQPLRHIFVLDRTKEKLVTPLTGKDKLDTLRQFTYMTQMLSGLGQIENHFRQWLELANVIPMSAIGYPSEDSTRSWGDRIDRLLLE